MTYPMILNVNFGKGGTEQVLATERIRLAKPHKTEWGQTIHGFAYVPAKGCWVCIDQPWTEGRIEGVTA